MTKPTKRIDDVIKRFDKQDAICNVCKSGIKSFLRTEIEALVLGEEEILNVLNKNPNYEDELEKEW